jgi:hypothetical protein
VEIKKHPSHTPHDAISQSSSSAYFPFHLLDADLLSGLLIIIIPLAFLEIDRGELSSGFNTLCFPFSLFSLYQSLGGNILTCG